MKLYNVKRNSRVRLLEDADIPPGAPSVKKGDEIQFGHTDGMYSFCTKDDGTVIHIAAWTEVEVV